MPIITPKTVANFNCMIDGTVGEFTTPAGRVFFFQTRARLRRGDTTNAGRLTSLLTPAREAIDAQQMDFNQLLQRDLDDHRIAHELVPYILRRQGHGPAFFPPILAALLPFQDRRPRTQLEQIVESEDFVDPMFEGHHWKTWTASEVFRLQLLRSSDGELDPAGQAVLRWNDERAKLIIMDGQHRAMALLAIHRTLTNSWGAAAAASERYKPFYEARVNELWSEAEAAGETSSIEGLEFPVTVCLFPDYSGPERNPHMAARKLFVDVNKEAKPPSESRLILLSDVRLNHILARELLNQLRQGEWSSKFPLYTVEYDNPEPKSSQPRRWNAVTNLEILLRSVEFCCFGPEEVISGVATLTKNRAGRPYLNRMNSYFRQQMRLQDVLEAEIPDGPRKIDRQEIGLEKFPLYNQEARTLLHQRFFNLWGRGLLRLLSEIEPYKQYIAAARSIEQSWGPSADVAGALAREALFDSVGMFWTLEQGFNHWQQGLARANAAQVPPPAQNDICRAWNLVQFIKKEEFEKTRARLYLGKDNDKEVVACRGFYKIAVTYAAQLGLALTWALLRHQNPASHPDEILDAMIAGINRSISTGPVNSRNRKLIFSREEEDPFNQLPRMESSFAAYFRVFWMELLLLPENRSELEQAGVDVDGAMDLLKKGRQFYIAAVADDYAASLKRTHDDWSLPKCATEGKASAINSLARAYKKWFGGTVEQWRDTLTELNKEEPEDLEHTTESDDDPDAPVETPEGI